MRQLVGSLARAHAAALLPLLVSAMCCCA
jgi:hypothetical protein